MDQLGNRWDNKPLFVLGLLCLLSTKERQLAFCGSFGEITTVRFFIVGDGTILVLLFGLFFRFLACCVAHITSVALVTVWLGFAEFVVTGFGWRGRWGPMARMCGSRRCAEVHGVFWAVINGLIFRT